MQSEWRITKNMVGTEPWFQCYKLADRDSVDHSGNRIEDHQMFRLRSIAEKRCKELNREEASRCE